MRSQVVKLLSVLVLLCGGAAVVAEDVQILSSFIRVSRQVEIPASEAGVLARVLVQEGQMVTQGQLLAQIDDTDAKVAARRAQRDLAIAQRAAQSRLAIEFAGKALGKAKVELARAVDAKRQVPNSVSNARMDDLNLAVERGKFELQLSEQNFEVAGLTAKLKESDVEVAKRGLERRRIVSSIDGLVVEKSHEVGEWVEPGRTVIKVLLLKRVRAEGFIQAKDIRPDLMGSAVTVTAQIPGKPAVKFQGRVTFVNPERQPVNGQARIWAEVDNPDLLLAPGVPVSMTVHVGQLAESSLPNSSDSALPRISSQKKQPTNN
ncbi:MAG: efflux RND transporter periplasmic adaptor subunit [Planctomycetota bacterium]|nr:efflux RND transporter periplasmic adaptor subunit [Planctomycetota bacterium]